jgi:thiol-disulfide isomerase/thioredoxin
MSMKMSAKTALGLVVLIAIVAAMGSITHREDRRESTGQDLKGLIPWRSDIDSARRDAIAANKPLLIEFVASWCPDCHELAEECWTQPSFADAMKGYIPVLIDVDAQPDVAKQYGVEAIPRFFVIDAKSGNTIRDTHNQLLPPDELLAWLK